MQSLSTDREGAHARDRLGTASRADGLSESCNLSPTVVHADVAGPTSSSRADPTESSSDCALDRSRSSTDEDTSDGQAESHDGEHFELEEATMLAATQLRRLGRGACGVVHLVELTRPDGSKQLAARKRLPNNGPDAVLSMERELWGTATAEASPFATRVLGAMLTPEWLEMYFAFSEQGSLTDRLDAARSARKKLKRAGACPEPQLLLPPEELRSVTFSVLHALSCMHAQGVGHWDVKPANVLLGARGRYCLADMGCAEAVDEEGLVRGARGSPKFMAPEALTADAYGLKADCYSVGVLMCECAFWHDDLVKAMAYQRGACDLPQHTPAALRSFMEALTERDPARRPSAAEALRHKFLAGVCAEDCM